MYFTDIIENAILADKNDMRYFKWNFKINIKLIQSNMLFKDLKDLCILLKINQNYFI